MSSPNRHTNDERPRHAARGEGALGSGTGANPGRLRLRTTRRAEPDMRKLVEWVLDITQARYDAHLAGEPDPYDLPPPDELVAEPHNRHTSRQRTMKEPEPLDERNIA